MRSSFSPFSASLFTRRGRWAQCLMASAIALALVASPVVPEVRNRPPSKRVLQWAQQNAIRAACMNNARKLAALVLRYSRDNEGRLPDFSSTFSLQAALSPYTNDSSLFFCPTGQPYRGNAALSGKTIQSIPNFANQVLLAEPRRAHIGGKVVVLGDGRVILR